MAESVEEARERVAEIRERIESLEEECERLRQEAEEAADPVQSLREREPVLALEAERGENGSAGRLTQLRSRISDARQTADRKAAAVEAAEAELAETRRELEAVRTDVKREQVAELKAEARDVAADLEGRFEGVTAKVAKLIEIGRVHDGILSHLDGDGPARPLRAERSVSHYVRGKLADHLRPHITGAHKSFRDMTLQELLGLDEEADDGAS